ncbi:MAG: HAD family phosphatase [Alphaproteobacteria bacterium]|nr:HAD family phosphatase [Alphaproteobacteria bacterium]
MQFLQRHVIFDLDGTIFDTEFEVSKITAELAADRGCAMTAEDVFRQFAGLGCEDKFAGIAHAAGMCFTSAEITELTLLHEDRKQQIYYREHLPVVAGVPDVLKALSAAGDILSIGSSNPSARSRLGLQKENLLDHFGSRIYGPDLVDGRKKPDPAIFLLAMRANGSSTTNTIVIEDTEPGLLSSPISIRASGRGRRRSKKKNPCAWRAPMLWCAISAMC